MSGPNTDGFFSALPEITRFQDVVDSARHEQAPADWWVVITDVQGSTEAIEAGRYRDVNALGVASILALRNALPDLELPFVFGGDGATVLVPSSRREAVETALRGIRTVAADAFQMKLRVGCVSVSELSEAGEPVRVGRYRQSPHIALAAFSGSGLSVAERWVKDPVRGQRHEVSAQGPAEADLSGFECRWQPIKSRRGQVVSLLMVAVEQTRQERESCYEHVLGRLREILGEDAGRPVSPGQMQLKTWGGDYSIEARLHSGQSKGAANRRVWRRVRRKTLGGRILMRLGMSGGGFNPTQYLDELTQNTDFRKFDEALRMVLDLDPRQVVALKAFLGEQWDARRLAWGVFESDEALVTCIVRSFHGEHVHFVDGADGGYALASRQLKRQLKQLAEEESG